MTSAYDGPERRSGIDRRHSKRRTGDRFAADSWRFSGQPNRRSGEDRRDSSERRKFRRAEIASTLPLPEVARGPDKTAAAIGVIENRQLRVVYQPIYRLKTGHVFGYEALARVDSPEFDTLPELYQAASAAGHVGELGRLHRSQAIKHCPNQPLFINIFPSEFDYGLLVQPDDAIFRHQQPVILEVTESIPLEYFDQCHDVIRELRKKGIQLAIDDLGAGYSNLKYIADLVPDFVKLDRSLIQGVEEGNRQAKLLRMMVRLCKNMGARVIAEGIETIRELVVAERAGVDFCQGFLLGRPDPSPGGESWPAFH